MSSREGEGWGEGVGDVRTAAPARHQRPPEPLDAHLTSLATRAPHRDPCVCPSSLEAALQVDILLLAVSGSFSKAQVPVLLEQIEAGLAKGSPHRLKVIIDNSSAFRYDDRFPLVIPEINTAAAFPSSKPRSVGL